MCQRQGEFNVVCDSIFGWYNHIDNGIAHLLDLQIIINLKKKRETNRVIILQNFSN